MDCQQRQLPHELSAVGTARHWVNDLCAHALSTHGQQLLELLTSEVVANAVVHGHGPLTVAVRCSPRQVVVAVTDTSADPPTVRHVDLEATGGRGVALVAALASQWGWEPASPGKRVWFRISEDRRAAA